VTEGTIAASEELAAIDENPLVVESAVAAALSDVSRLEKAFIVTEAESTSDFFLSMSVSGWLAMSTSWETTVDESNPPSPESCTGMTFLNLREG
jgi:hypothetical protein